MSTNLYVSHSSEGVPQVESETSYFVSDQPPEERIKQNRSVINNSTQARDSSIASKPHSIVQSATLIVVLCLILILLVAILIICGLTLFRFNRSIAFRNRNYNSSGRAWSLNSNNFSYGGSESRQILMITKASARKLINIANTLSNLQSTSTSTAGVVDTILLVVQDLLELHNNSASSPTALHSSCKEIKDQQPNSPSGLYLLKTAATINSEGFPYKAYCNMEELCDSGGGWTRLAYLDMLDTTQSCPSAFRLYQSGGVRACGRPVSDRSSCISVQFPSNGISYSQICGRVVGYQYGSTDTHSNYFGMGSIDGSYVDGVSITRGFPRQHVWTLMCGFNEVSVGYSSNCPCGGSTIPIQSFIGSNYFCESGRLNVAPQYPLFTSDPLWDGKSCGPAETACCSVPGLPWFHRDFGTNTTTDYIELRVCGNEGTDNEDVPLSYYEIYVK